MTLVWITLVALAAEPVPLTPGEVAPAPDSQPERPLAIPSATPAPSAPPAPGERAAGVRAYAKRHLAVRSLSEFYATPATTTFWGGRWGGWATTSPGYVVRSDTWAVYEGEHRLDVLSYLDTIGDTSRRVTLERQIRSNRTAGTVLTVLGVAGIGAAVTGLVGMETANTVGDAQVWSNVSLIGLGTGVTGLVAGSFPHNRARRLASYPDRTLDRRQVERDVEEYNGRLASELGLSAEAAVRVEMRERAEPPR